MNCPPKKAIDVLGLGCTAVDDLLYVPSFPAADQKAEVEWSVRKCGGLTGMALVTAARLGARCAFAGRLGTDESSDYVARDLEREGIDASRAPRSPKGGVVRSTVIVGAGTGSRNIFYEIRGQLGAHGSLPTARLIRGCKVLFIDHYGMRGNLRAARIARSAGVAVVADFEDYEVPLFQDLLKLVDHLILSERFALEATRKSTAAEAALALWRADRAVVIITCGAEGCWCVSGDSGSRPIHYPAFAVHATDTTGCGDVFHGAYAASLARGDSLAERIRFAAAAAALKAMRGEVPWLSAVQKFLRAQASTQDRRKVSRAALPPHPLHSSAVGRNHDPIC